MADAPEVYQPVPHGSQQAFTGPYYGGPRPEAEGLQVHSAYAENYNKAPYSDNPTVGAPIQYAENQPGGFIQPTPYPDGQYVQPTEKSWRKRRICGLSALVFWCLIVAAVLVIVGAVVGGVIGSQKSKSSNQVGNSSQDRNGGGDSNTSSSVSTPAATTPTHTTTTPTSSTTSSSASATATSPFKEDTFYRLSNQYLGKGLALDIRNTDGTNSRQLNMSTTGNHQGQFWQISQVPNTESTYWFACLYLGKKVRMTVDPLDRVNPLMEDADDTLDGQKWIIGSVLDGTWLISNVFSGAGIYLSTYSDTHQLFMDTQTDSGQKWSIATARKILPADGF